MLRARSGLAIGPDKLYLLEVRLAPILKAQRLRDLDALAARLRQPGAEPVTPAVVEAMTSNESFFFRDDKPFAHFRAHPLPGLLAARGGGAPLRIWSAANSSGHEAYSPAMIVAECGAAVGERRVEILGTDLSREQNLRAREGLYNLLSDLRPLGRFDIVFCRNVLIYFDRPTKQRALEAVARQMTPDGLLYLRGAETVLGVTDRFVALAGERGVYRQAAPGRLSAAALAAMAG